MQRRLERLPDMASGRCRRALQLLEDGVTCAARHQDGNGKAFERLQRATGQTLRRHQAADATDKARQQDSGGAAIAVLHQRRAEHWCAYDVGSNAAWPGAASSRAEEIAEGGNAWTTGSRHAIGTGLQGT